MCLEAKVNNIGVNMNHDFDNVMLPKLKSCAVLAIKLFECVANCVLQCLIIVLHALACRQQRAVFQRVEISMKNFIMHV